MNKKRIRGVAICLAICTVIISVTALTIMQPQNAFALPDNKSYVLFGNDIFIVFNTNNNDPTVVDAGIHYKEKWHLLNTTTTTILDSQNNSTKIWVAGTLDSGLPMFFTWILEDSKAKIKVWILDDKSRDFVMDASIHRLFVL